MNKGLMAVLYERVGHNTSALRDSNEEPNTFPLICYDKDEDEFLFAMKGSPITRGEYGGVYVCTREQYEDYIKQHNESSSPNSIFEAFQLLETLAKQSNYDINITSVGTIIYDETAEEIRGTPEQLYKILEAQIHLRNLVKEATSE